MSKSDKLQLTERQYIYKISKATTNFKWSVQPRVNLYFLMLTSFMDVKRGSEINIKFPLAVLLYATTLMLISYKSHYSVNKIKSKNLNEYGAYASIESSLYELSFHLDNDPKVYSPKRIILSTILTYIDNLCLINRFNSNYESTLDMKELFYLAYEFGNIYNDYGLKTEEYQKLRKKYLQEELTSMDYMKSSTLTTDNTCSNIHELHHKKGLKDIITTKKRQKSSFKKVSKRKDKN